MITNYLLSGTAPKKMSRDFLHAIYKGDTDLVAKLAHSPKVDVNIKDVHNATPLLWCCSQGDALIKIVDLLLKHPEVDVNEKDRWGDTALIRCCIQGNRSLGIARLLMKHKKIDVNLKDRRGCPPLMRYCYAGHKSLGIPKLLVNHPNIDINIKDDVDGATPLLCCCNTGDTLLGMADLLLGHAKINVNIKAKWGDTPLIRCYNQGDRSLKIAQRLLEHPNIDVNFKDSHCYTPLLSCCNSGDKTLGMARLLLRHPCIDVNLKNKWGSTPLDVIVYWIVKGKKDYIYADLWNLLVEKGGRLENYKKDYEKLDPSNFKEPQRGYIQSIKHNPPMNVSLVVANLLKEIDVLKEQLNEVRNKNMMKVDGIKEAKEFVHNKCTNSKHKFEEEAFDFIKVNTKE